MLESEKRSDFPGPLAGLYDVPLVAKPDGQWRNVKVSLIRSYIREIRIVTSSRWRQKSAIENARQKCRMTGRQARILI